MTDAAALTLSNPTCLRLPQLGLGGLRRRDPSTPPAVALLTVARTEAGKGRRKDIRVLRATRRCTG
jgi:hypothetical protein